MKANEQTIAAISELLEDNDNYICTIVNNIDGKFGISQISKGDLILVLNALLSKFKDTPEIFLEFAEAAEKAYDYYKRETKAN